MVDRSTPYLFSGGVANLNGAAGLPIFNCCWLVRVEWWLPLSHLLSFEARNSGWTRNGRSSVDQNRERKEWVGGKLAESPLPCDHKIQIKNGACAHVMKLAVWFPWQQSCRLTCVYTRASKRSLIYLGANQGTLLLNEVGSGKMRRQRKIGEQKRSLHLFSAREKMVTDRASVADVRPWQLGLPRKQLRPPRRIEQMSFSAVCPTNFTVRRSYNYKNMYNLYVLSRNFEPEGSAEWSYCWILHTIEFMYYWETKRLDLNRLSIWTTVFC